MYPAHHHGVPIRGRRAAPPESAHVYQFGSVVTPQHAYHHQDLKPAPMTTSALVGAACVPPEDKAFNAGSPSSSSAYTLVDEEHDTQPALMPTHFHHNGMRAPVLVPMVNPYIQHAPPTQSFSSPSEMYGYASPNGMVPPHDYSPRMTFSVHPSHPPGTSLSPPSTFFHPQPAHNPAFVSYCPPDHIPVYYPTPSFHYGSPTYPSHPHPAFVPQYQPVYDTPPPYHAQEKRRFSQVEYQGPLMFPYPPPSALPPHLAPLASSPSSLYAVSPCSPSSSTQSCPTMSSARVSPPSTMPRDSSRNRRRVMKMAPTLETQSSLSPQKEKLQPASPECEVDSVVVPPTDPHVFTPRSTLLVQFRSNRKRDWTVLDIKGHIPEFSQDLFASRFIQDSITSGSEVDLIFEELSLPSNLVAVSMNSSGNYVIQKLLLNASESQTRILADTLIHHIAPLSLDTYGCRVIQTLIDLATPDLRACIAKESEPHTPKFITDVNANHVVQKLLGTAPECMEFIVHLLKGRVAEVARDDFGCRVLQRCIHDLSSIAARPLIEEFLPFTLEMVTHEFGNFVVQKLLEQGGKEVQDVILAHLHGNFLRCAQHKYGSNVCERVMECVDTPIRQAIIREMLVLVNNFPKGIYQLMVHQYGNYVLQKALKLAKEPERSELMEASRHQLAYARRAKSNNGHRNKDKQLDSIEVLLDRVLS